MKLLLAGKLELTDEQVGRLNILGYECTFMSDERNRVEKPEAFDAVICNGLFLHNEVSEFKNLKFVQSTSAGTERLPIEYFDNHGIVWRNATSVYSVPIAEWVIMSALNLLRNGKALYERQNAKIWEKDRTQRELNGMTVTIVGLGSVGLECAKRCKAFDTEVVGVDIKKIASPYVDVFYEASKLNEALKITDILVLCCSLTEDTFKMIGKEQFDIIKRNALLINASRGQVVDEMRLIEALKNKCLSGAALDVFENEPLDKGSALWDMPNVLISPHSSFISNRNADRLFALVYDNLVKFKENAHGA